MTRPAEVEEVPADADPSVHMEALGETLRAEVRLLERLEGILQAQRDGVAKGDLKAVDASVYDAQRVLLTLAEARRHRNQVLEVALGQSAVSVRDLEDAVARELPDEVVAARDALLTTARRLSGRVEDSQTVLRTAMEENDRHLRELYGGGERSPGYGSGGKEAGEDSGGRLFNRQV